MSINNVMYSGVSQNLFLDPEGGSPKATLVVLALVAVISSLEIPKVLLISVHIRAHIPYRSTVSVF